MPFTLIHLRFHWLSVFFTFIGNCTGRTRELTVGFLPRLQVLTWMAHLWGPSSPETWNTWSFSLSIPRIRNSTGRSPAGEWYEHPFSLLVFVAEPVWPVRIVLSCLGCVQWWESSCHMLWLLHTTQHDPHSTHHLPPFLFLLLLCPPESVSLLEARLSIFSPV